MKAFKVIVREIKATLYVISSRDVNDAEEAKAEIEAMTEGERERLQSQVEKVEWFVDGVEEIKN